MFMGWLAFKMSLHHNFWLMKPFPLALHHRLWDFLSLWRSLAALVSAHREFRAAQVMGERFSECCTCKIPSLAPGCIGGWIRKWNPGGNSCGVMEAAHSADTQDA